MPHKWRFPLADAMARLPAPDGKRSTAVFEHGTLLMKVYAPRGHDPQQPHEQDEVYIVMAGSGTFAVDGERVPFDVGDALFVPAKVEHRFEDFTDNLTLWVVFYGPAGGETA